MKALFPSPPPPQQHPLSETFFVWRNETLPLAKPGDFVRRNAPPRFPTPPEKYWAAVVT